MYKSIKSQLYISFLIIFLNTNCSDVSTKTEKMVTASKYLFYKVFPNELQGLITSYLGFWEHNDTINDSMSPESTINCLAFSNNGKYLAIGQASNLDVRDLVKKELKFCEGSATIKGAFPYPFSVMFSNNDKYLAVGYSNGNIRILGLDSETFIINLKGHSDGVMCLACSNDSKTLASGSRDRTIKIWDIDNSSKTYGNCLHTISEHTSGIRDLAFSNDNLNLASASLDTTARIWDVNSLKLIQALDHNRPVVSLAYSIDGKLATGSRGPDHTQDVMNIWDPKTGKLLKQIREKAILSIAYSNDGKYLANIGPMRLRIHNVNNGTIQEIFLDENAVHINLVAFSKDCKHIAASFKEGEKYIIRIWTNEDPDLKQMIKVEEESNSDN